MTAGNGIATGPLAAHMATRREAASALAGVMASGNDLEQSLAAQALGRIGDASAADALVAALRDPDEDVRIDAATAISALSIRQAIPVLVENIAQDPSVDAKIADIAAVARLRAREAVPVLRKLVGAMAEDEIAWDEEDLAQSESDDWLEVQLKAVEALGEIGAQEAAEDVRAAMEDEFGQDLLRPGLAALSNMGPAGLAIVMDYLRDGSARERRTAAECLGRCAPDVLAGCLDQLLADADGLVRSIALQALPDADPRLVDCLKDADEDIRAQAAARLVRAQPARLAAYLGDDSDAVRVSVLEAFCALDERPAVSDVDDQLLAWLDKGAPALACASAHALSVIAPQASVEPLRRMALRRGAAGEVRRAAVQALADVSPATAIETLVAIARDPLRPIRLQAVGALAHIAERSSGDVRQRALAVLLSALSGTLILPSEGDDSPATDGSEAAAAPRHGGHAAKEDSAGQVNRIRIDRDGNIIEERPRPAEESLAAASGDQVEPEPAGDEDDAFPLSTLDALQSGLMGEAAEAAEEHIELTAEDLSFLELAQGRKGKRVSSPEQRSPAHTDVRVLAARTLKDLAEPDVVDALVAVLGEPNEELRLAAATSLCDLLPGPEGLGEATAVRLAQHMGDQSAVLRLWLTRAASSARCPSLRTALGARTADMDQSVRAEAVLGLARVDAAFDPTPYLTDEDTGVRQRAGEAMLERHGPAACAVLLELAFGHGGADRVEAARLLRRADPVAANQAVIERMQTAKTALVRRIAIEVLGELNASAPPHALLA